MKRAVLLLCTLSLLALCGCGQQKIAPSAPAETSVSDFPVSYPEAPESQGLTIARTEISLPPSTLVSASLRSF